MPPPEGLWGMPPELLRTLTGYDPDVERNRVEARKIMKALGLGIFCIDREANDTVFAMRVDVNLRDFGDLAGTEDDDICHAEALSPRG